MVDAYLGLGSNLGNRAGYLKLAVDQLRREDDVRVVAISSIYETDPVGPISQDKYLNAVVQVKTALSPHALLDCIRKIETQNGRIRDERWGPRTLDIDVLLYGNSKLETDKLQIPHPELANRAFVLAPLSEIRPDLKVESQPVPELLSKVGMDGVERLIRFEQSQTVGVVGASSKEHRYSNRAQRMLMKSGHSVVPFSLKDESALGVPCYRSVSDYQGSLDTITLYLSPDRLRPLVSELIAASPKRVIFNPGTESPEVQSCLEEAGIKCENACTLVLLQTDQFISSSR